MIYIFEVYVPDDQNDKIEDIEENLISIEEFVERSIVTELKMKGIDATVNHVLGMDD